MILVATRTDSSRHAIVVTTAASLASYLTRPVKDSRVMSHCTVVGFTGLWRVFRKAERGNKIDSRSPALRVEGTYWCLLWRQNSHGDSVRTRGRVFSFLWVESIGRTGSSRASLLPVTACSQPATSAPLPETNQVLANRASPVNNEHRASAEANELASSLVVHQMSCPFDSAIVSLAARTRADQLASSATMTQRLLGGRKRPPCNTAV